MDQAGTTETGFIPLALLISRGLPDRDAAAHSCVSWLTLKWTGELQISRRTRVALVPLWSHLPSRPPSAPCRIPPVKSDNATDPGPRTDQYVVPKDYNKGRRNIAGHSSTVSPWV
jgi:hypothetical protein